MVFVFIGKAYDSPIIEVKPSNTTFKEGVNVTLSCWLSEPTYSAYEIKWYKDGNVGEIKSDESDGDRDDEVEKYVLQLKSLTVKDEGEYRCVIVRRDLGYQNSGSTKIIVEGIIVDNNM